jgi:Pectate lyase superfamily protein
MTTFVPHYKGNDILSISLQRPENKMRMRPQFARINLIHLASLGLIAAGGIILPATASATSKSVYTEMPADPAAKIVKGVGDGLADDTDALQTAIDQAAKNRTGGIVFIPSGRYRLSSSLLVPPAIRLFGVGPTRPVLVLANDTAGFQKGVATLVVFTGADQYSAGRVPVPVPTVVPPTKEVRDANSATFYTALSNVDFEIGRGNPAAAAVRMRTAQHSFLSHIDFHLGSGFAGIYQGGNECEDLHFFGGRYGIVSEKTSPAWQFTLVDSSFEGQSGAAIREHEAGLTLVNTTISQTPVGIEIDRGYGDWLWGKRVRFQGIAKAAVIISNEGNAYTQIGFEDAVAQDVPVFAMFRDSGKTVGAPGLIYRVSAFNYGLAVSGLGTTGTFATNFKAQPLAAMPALGLRAIPELPPASAWVNVHGLGATGDGSTDDTAAIQKAVDANRVVYFPSGFYVVRESIRLRPNSVLIALHPSLTQLVIPDNTVAYQGVGGPKALLESAAGGNAIVSGIGLSTGDTNPRAVALLWKAGAESLVDDVKIQGGHGTLLANGAPLNPYESNRPENKIDPQAQWDRQCASILVTDGGGGTFANVWSPNTVAQTGFYVSNTTTPGHVYQLSAEHHVRAEIVLDHVANWEFLAPQTEEEVRESPDAVSLEVRNSRDILFANYHGYRVTRTFKPAESAVKLYNSGGIRFRNVHVNGESGYAGCSNDGCGTYLRATKFPFEKSIEDVTHKLELREREFAKLDIPFKTVAAQPAPRPAGLTGAAVEKLGDGFFSISGGAVDSTGRLYFVEHRFQRIYRWSEAEGLAIVNDLPLDPVNLFFDRSGNLLVLSSNGPQGTVYSFAPDRPGNITVIPATPSVDHPGAASVLPVNFWNNGEFRDQLDPQTYTFATLAEMFTRDMAVAKAKEYVSPDGSVVLPAFPTIQQGPTTHLGWRFSDILDTYGFLSAKLGEHILVSNGSEDRVYRGVVGRGGSVTDLVPLTNRGGESVAADPDGRFFVANGQVFVYSADGHELGRIDIPERPLQLLFGGSDRRMLYILAHHALFRIRLGVRRPPDKHAPPGQKSRRL